MRRVTTTTVMVVVLAVILGYPPLIFGPVSMATANPALRNGAKPYLAHLYTGGVYD